MSTKTKIEYRVRSVTRYTIARFEDRRSQDGKASGSVQSYGEFASEQPAILAAQSMAHYEPGAVFDAAPAVANKHKVPKKKWDRWCPKAQQTFNWLFNLMYGSPELFLHPKSPEPSEAGRKTTAWNAAWLAADAVHEAVTGKDAEI